EDSYSNWANGEPNDSSDEDCGQFYVENANWNDLDCELSELDGYVVEYGDNEATPEVATKNITITVIGETIEVGTCEELQAVDEEEDAEYATILLTNDIDCEGIDFEPLFAGHYFGGTFDGQNH